MDLSKFTPIENLIEMLTGLQAGSDLYSRIVKIFRGRFDWDRFWRDTETCFEAALDAGERTNHQQLPIRGLNRIKKALMELRRSGSTDECSTVVKDVLERDWKITSKVRLGDLAEAYCDCARHALLAQSFKDQPGFLLVASALFDLEKVIRNGANRTAKLSVSNYGDNVERFLDFYLREERVFVGREDELNALHQKAIDWEQGFAFVSAPAGKGKSALLSRLWLGIHTSRRSDIKAVFMPISTRFGTATKKAFYERLAHELSVVYGIEKPEAGSEVEALRNYTRSLLKQPPDERLKLVLIVDGLDEATDWNPIKENESPFPLRLGAQVRLVLSARTTPDYADAASWSGALGLPPDRGLFLNLGNLSKADVRRALAEARLPEIAPEDAEVVANELYRLTEEGDPLLLDLYLDALNPQKGGIPKLTADKLINIAPGYAGYFESWQEALESRLRHQGLGDLRDLAVTVFTILSYAKGPLSRVDLGAVVRFWLTSKGQNDEYFAVRFEKILEHGNRLLAGNDEALSLAHPRLGEFFQQRYGVHESDFERTYANWGLNAWREAKTITDNRMTRPLPRYLLEHLSSHLADLGMLDELAELVVDPIWFQQSHEHDSTLRLLAQDLNRLLDLAMDQEKRPDIWTTDVFYLNRLHGNANNLPPAIFSYFGKAGRAAEALRWIELTTNKAKRREALLALTNALPPQKIHSFAGAIIRQAHSLKNAIRAQAISLIIKRLAELDQEGALEVALGIEDDLSKIMALAEVASALVGVDAEKALKVADEALGVAQEIRDFSLRAKAFAEVAKALAGVDAEKALKVADEALGVAQEIRDFSLRAKAFAEVAKALAGVDAEKALKVADEALGVAQEIMHDSGRITALAEIAKTLSGVDAEKALSIASEAMKIALEIEDYLFKITAIMEATKALTRINPEKALEMARRIEVDLFKIMALAEVAKALAGVDAEKTLKVADEALRAAQEIRDSSLRAKAFAEAAEALARVDAEKALEVAKEIEGGDNRARAFAEVAKALARVDADKALEVAKGIEGGDNRAKALAEVAKALAGVDAEKALSIANEAMEVVWGVEDEDNDDGTKVLANVTRVLAGVNPDKALDVAREIKYVNIRVEALMEVAKALAGANPKRALRVADEALELARGIRGEYVLRVMVLAEAAKALAGINPDKALAVASEALGIAGESVEAAREIDYLLRAIALAEVAKALAWVDAEKALEVAQGIIDFSLRAEALAEVAKALAGANPKRALMVADEALELARWIIHGSSRAKVAEALARVDADKALEVAKGIQDGHYRAKALAEVAKALAGVDADKALEVAKGIEDGDDRAKALAEVAKALAGANPKRALRVADEALELARGIRGYLLRVMVLTEVAKAFAGVDAEKARKAFIEAVGAARVGGLTWPWLEIAYPTLAAIAPEKIVYSYERLNTIRKLFESMQSSIPTKT